MKKLMISAVSLFAIALSFAITGSAEAATLQTPPLFVATGDSVGCNIANIGTKDVTVTIIIINTFGDETVNNGPQQVLAGRSLSQVKDPVDSGAFYRCKFISSSGNIRVSISRFNGNSSDLNGYGGDGK